jgi:hypothetical protein
MNNALAHTPTGAIVQFPAAPLRSNSTAVDRFQASGFDSNGDFYCYNRSNAYRHDIPLVYTNVPTAVLDALLIFIQSRNGDKNTFSWYDHDAASHTVRFTTGAASYKETSPGKYRVEISVTEDL